MPNVVRFALSTARDQYISGVGFFRDGILDVDANRLDLVKRARYLVQPYRAVEIGIVDSATPAPNLPPPQVPPAPNTDPYPQYPTVPEVRTLVTTDEAILDAQRAAFAPAKLARPGGRAVFLADSLGAGFTQETGIGGNTITVLGSSWPVFACALSDQRIQYVANAGVYGNTSAQMIARFTADVASRAPSLVTLMSGANDIDQAVPFAIWQANVRTLVGLVRGIGAAPVLCTMTPRSDNGTKRQTTATWNKWLRRYAARNDITLLDFYRQAVDPTTGGFLASYGSTDGLHPGVAGHLAMGQYAATVLAPLLPAGALELLTTPNDTDFIFGSTGIFQGTVTGGIAAGWEAGSAPSGSSFSVVTDTAVPGKMQRITANATGANQTYLHQGTSIGGASSAPGDIIAVSAVVTNANAGTVSELSKVRLSFGPGGYADVWASSANVTRARAYKEFAIPADSNQIDVQLMRDGGTGTFDVGQLSIVNLTRMGIVTP